MPFFLRSVKIQRTALASFWGVLKTHFTTGVAIASAAAQESSSVAFSSMYCLIFIDSPLVEGPMIAKTFSSSTSCLAKRDRLLGVGARVLDHQLDFHPVDAALRR